MRILGIEIFYWISDWATPQPPFFSKARECGFDAVEISLVNGPNIDFQAYHDALQNNALKVYCRWGFRLTRI